MISSLRQDTMPKLSVLLISNDMASKEWCHLDNNFFVLHSRAILDLE